MAGRKPADDVERESLPDDPEENPAFGSEDAELIAGESEAEGDVENAAGLGAGTDGGDVERETP